MTALTEFGEWCRQERQRARKQLASLEEGRCKVAEDRGHGWVDHTSDAIAKLTVHLAQLDELLRIYESERPESSRTADEGKVGKGFVIHDPGP